MKILLYSHFYYPEVGAASIRMQYFVKVLKDNGHQVKIITPKPNYPDSKKYEGFNNFFNTNKEENVYYLPIYLPKKFSVLKRGLSYISYMLSSFFYSLFDSFNPDIIISSSPPVSTSLSAVLIAKLKRKPIILDVRDLWPDIGIELGIIQNKYLIRLLIAIDKFILKNSARISVPLSGFVDVFKRKGVPSGNITPIYNGADSEVFKPLSDNEKREIREKYNLPQDRRILVYFGFFNFGMNDTDILNEALVLLSSKKDEFHVLLIGDGARRVEFTNKLDGKINYTHITPQPQEVVSKLIASCDFSVIPLKKVKRQTGGFIPVKCLESWATGIPVIMSVNEDEEIQTIFKNCKAGDTIEAGNSKLLSEAIISLVRNENISDLGSNGRAYVIENFDRGKQSSKILDIIKSIIDF